MGLGFLAFVGGLLAGVPMLIAGFADQPGAVFPSVEPGVDGVIKFSYSGPSGLWNVLTGIGLTLLLVSVLAFVALALRSAFHGERAGDDPWDGQTLEWATTSPAPSDNFAQLHVITSAEPLLDLKPATNSDRSDA
jgi:heme/copper-type cytochrome/quinol oxidase subunit 1